MMMEETNVANRQSHRLPPCLLISHGKHREKQSFYNLAEKKFHRKSIPQLVNKCILGSAYGWFVLVDHDSNDCCLWNPLFMLTIGLPKLEESSTYDKCVLSKPPTHTDCHILFLSCCHRCYAFCQLGDDEFVVKSLLGDEEQTAIIGATSFQKMIYCYVETIPCYPHIRAAHFIGKTLELRPILSWGVYIGSLLPTWGGLRREYLIESACGRELLLVYEIMSSSRLYDDGLIFRIFRVDINGKEFAELENIGDQAIFLNHQGDWGCGGGVCSSSKGIQPNSVYYTVPNSKNLYIYDFVAAVSYSQKFSASKLLGGKPSFSKI